MGPIAAALLALGTSIAGNVATNAINRRGEQRVWKQQQAYNHPLMQMQRLRQAGLNPHLVYGQSASGATGSASAPAKNPDMQIPMPNFDELQTSYVARKKQQVEIDNLETQRELMRADIAKRGVESSQIMAQTAKTEFDLGQADRLKDISFEAAVENLNNTRTTGRKIGQEIDNLIVESAVKKQNIRESQQRINESVQRIKNLKVDNNMKGIEMEIKQIELQLRRLGINPNDPAGHRIIGRVLEESGLSDNLIQGVRSVSGKVRDWLFKPQK